jgi:acyl-CoA thioester hydrolase
MDAPHPMGDNLGRWNVSRRICQGEREVVRTRVYYADTDAGGVAYYANYLRWFEMARFEFVDELGLSVVDYARRGVNFAVAHLEIDYRRPALLGDEVRVLTDVEEVRRVRFTLNNRVVRCADGQELVSARITLACLDPAGRVLGLPVELAERLRDRLQRTGDHPGDSGGGGQVVDS